MIVSERIRNQRLRNWIHAVPITNVLPLIYFSTADTYTDEDFRQARTGVAGRVNYNYANKYFHRRPYAPRCFSISLQPDRRVGYFPSVSAAWRVTEEGFMKNLPGQRPHTVRHEDQGFLWYTRGRWYRPGPG